MDNTRKQGPDLKAPSKVKRLKVRELVAQPLPEWAEVVRRVRKSSAYQRHLESLSKSDAPAPLIVAFAEDGKHRLVHGREAVIAAADLEIEKLDTIVIAKDDVPAFVRWLGRNATRPQEHDEDTEYYSSLYEEDEFPALAR